MFATARITRIETGAAAAMPGVVAILTGRDLQQEVETVAFLPGQLTPRQPALATRVVRYAGEPIVAVVAETRGLAEDACELVEVDYEPLEAVVDPLSALEPESTLVHDELGTNSCFSYRVGVA